MGKNISKLLKQISDYSSLAPLEFPMLSAAIQLWTPMLFLLNFSSLRRFESEFARGASKRPLIFEVGAREDVVLALLEK